MKKDDLLRAIGALDDELVSAAAPGTSRRTGSRWPRWAAAAACVCLIAAGGAALSLRPAPVGPEPGPTSSAGPAHSAGPGTAVTPPETDAVPTSETYQSLSQLLSWLSSHDDHSSRKSDQSTAGGDVIDSAAGSGAVTRDGYVYHLSRAEGASSLCVSRLGAGAELLTTLELDAWQLFLWGDRLAAVGRDIEPLSLDDPGWTWVKLYDLSDPVRPALTGEFSLLGEPADCWQDGSSLYLLTQDGVCACGWSRLSDPAGYLPRLKCGGQTVPWGEEDTAVLGEPSRIWYTAAVRIDLATGELAGKRAFYGDVEGIFHGEGWLALTTGGHTADGPIRPQLYSFTTAFLCDGKLDAAALPGVDGGYPELVSVYRAGDVLRAVGYVQDGAGSARLLAAALDLSTGEQNCALARTEGFFHIGDLLWDGDRAVLCVTAIDQELDKEDALWLAGFAGTQTELVSTGLTCDSVDGVDMMYSYGSPLGWLNTLIPLGGGRYLRYNGVPDGLDLYDLSGEPRRLYTIGGLPGGGGRLEFRWAVLDAQTVGLLTVWPNENGEYRNVTYTWDVYEIGESGLTRLSRTPVSDPEVTVLRTGGGIWLAQADGAITPLAQ